MCNATMYCYSVYLISNSVKVMAFDQTVSNSFVSGSVSRSFDTRISLNVPFRRFFSLCADFAPIFSSPTNRIPIPLFAQCPCPPQVLCSRQHWCPAALAHQLEGLKVQDQCLRTDPTRQRLSLFTSYLVFFSKSKFGFFSPFESTSILLSW